MANIEYKRELFDLVNDLTAINKSVAFERMTVTDESGNVVEEKIAIRKSDKNRTIVYLLKVPVNYFDIDSTVAFYDYANFYKFLTSIKDVKLTLNEDKMILAGNGIKLHYLLSDEEGIINGPKKINFNNPDVRFTLTKEDLDEIVRLNSLVKGNKANISCVGNTLTIKFYTNSSDNSFEKTFECERLTDYEMDIDFTIFANRFEYLPSKRDYVFDISAKKYIQISLIHEEIELLVYTGEVN